MPVVDRFRASLDRLALHADRDVRLQAARCVGHLPGAMGLGRMRELAEDPDAEVRLEALRALAERASAGGRPTLRQAFAEDTDLRCRRAALAGLVALEDRSIVPALRRLIRNPDAFVAEQSPQTQEQRQALCCEAVEALGLLGDEGVVDDLLGLLQRHVSPVLDGAAIRALSRLGDAGLGALTGLTEATTADRARRAVEALADHAEADQVEALGVFLGHADGGVRLAAAEALIRLAPCHSALLRRANDPEPAVRALVARHTGPTMPSALTLLLDDPSPTVVAAAVTAVAKVPVAARTDDLVLRVRCKLRHPSPEVACAAATTLAVLDPEAALPELAARLADPDAAPAVRVAAARTLATMATPAAFTRLAQQMLAAEAASRHAIVEALTALDGSEAATAVQRFLIDLVRGPTPAAAGGLAEAPATFGEISPDVRAELAGLLATRPTPAVEAALLPLTDEAMPTLLRLAGALALAQTVERLDAAAPATRARAATLLDADDARLRLAGLRILSLAPGDGDSAPVERCLDDDDPSVRALAMRCFGHARGELSPAVEARLAAALDDPAPGVRLAALDVLLRRSGIEVLGPVLEAILRHGDEGRPEVAHSLARLPADAVHDELAKRLAVACNRKRQMALLRLSDALLMSAGAVAA